MYPLSAVKTLYCVDSLSLSLSPPLCAASPLASPLSLGLSLSEISYGLSDRAADWLSLVARWLRGIMNIKGCESSLKIKPALCDIVASVQIFGSLLLTLLWFSLSLIYFWLWRKKAVADLKQTNKLNLCVGYFTQELHLCYVKPVWLSFLRSSKRQNIWTDSFSHHSLSSFFPYNDWSYHFYILFCVKKE